MRIAICGPVSLQLLKDLVSLKPEEEMPSGFPYPLAAYLARILHAKGHDVTLVSNVYGSSDGSCWKGTRISIELNNRRRVKQFVFDCYKKERQATLRSLERAQPDIAHAQWVYDYAHAVSDYSGSHLVTIRDDPWAIARFTRSPYRVFRALYAHSTVPKIQHLSAVSPYVAKPFKKIYRYKKPIRIIPNGLSESLFIRDNPRPQTRIRKARKFVSVTAWDRRKNVKTLLHAFGKLRRKCPEAELILVGFGLGRGEVGYRWALRHKLEQNVSFIGKLEHQEIIELLRECEGIFVHSTLEESFCMTVLEAMAQRLPVVALPGSGAVPWLLDQGRAGCLADSQTASDLALAMQKVYQDPEYLQAIADTGYQRARTDFTLEAVADAYLEAYDAVLTGRYNAP